MYMDFTGKNHGFGLRCSNLFRPNHSMSSIPHLHGEIILSSRFSYVVNFSIAPGFSRWFPALSQFFQNFSRCLCFFPGFPGFFWIFPRFSRVFLNFSQVFPLFSVFSSVFVPGHPLLPLRPLRPRCRTSRPWTRRRWWRWRGS